MAALVAKAKAIVKDPRISGGDPIFKGTRIRVSDVVVEWEHRGTAPEEIIGEFPGLTLPDVYAALTFYHEHPREIRQEIRRRERTLRAAK